MGGKLLLKVLEASNIEALKSKLESKQQCSDPLTGPG